MPKVVFVLPNRERQEYEVNNNTSLMELAVANGIPGIAAECGGACACGTCHVYVDEKTFQQMPARNESEEAMLEFADFPLQPTSRLSCQVRVAVDDDRTIIVTIPGLE